MPRIARADAAPLGTSTACRPLVRETAYATAMFEVSLAPSGYEALTAWPISATGSLLSSASVFTGRP